METSSFGQVFPDGIVGTVTGILTAFLLYLLKKFWDNYLHPWLRELRYSGVDVSGQWQGIENDEDGTSFEIALVLKQSAHDVSGTARIEFVGSSHSFDLAFNVTGQIWEGYITLNFKPVDKRVTSYATALLKIAGGGVALNGQAAYRNVNDERVDSFALELKRDARSNLKRARLAPAKAPSPKAQEEETAEV